MPSVTHRGERPFMIQNRCILGSYVASLAAKMRRRGSPKVETKRFRVPERADLRPKKLPHGPIRGQTSSVGPTSETRKPDLAIES
jgi:hypothetical protein